MLKLLRIYCFFFQNLIYWHFFLLYQEINIAGCWEIKQQKHESFATINARRVVKSWLWVFFIKKIFLNFLVKRTWMIIKYKILMKIYIIIIFNLFSPYFYKCLFFGSIDNNCHQLLMDRLHNLEYQKGNITIHLFGFYCC